MYAVSCNTINGGKTMKNFVRIASLVLVVVVLTMTLASCGGVSGSYTTGEALGTGVTYTFKGSKVTIEAKVIGVVTTFEGKFKVKDDKITFTFEDDKAKSYEGEFAFEKGKDYVKIAGITYTKADK